MANQPADQVRVGLDATVLFAGSGWPRWPREVLLAGLRGEIHLVVSAFVLEQARRNLSRKFPQHLPRFEEFLAQNPFEIVPEAKPEEIAQHKGLVRDDSDVPVVLPYLKAAVDYLVSEDKDLTAQDASTEKLRQHLTVMLSGTFLREVLGWTSEALEAIRHREWSEIED
jgi:predicted nucleic acid-binding protein